MLIIPAIDIMEGRVVRLMQGKFDEPTIYFDNPVEVAKKWVGQGAQRIHIVDLDGARTGKIKNITAIANIAKDTEVEIQVGGGIRDKETVALLFQKGVAKVILGTKIIEDRSFLQDMLGLYSEKIIVSIDAVYGDVAKEGWKSVSTIKATDLAKQMQDIGVKTIIYTNISRDGTLKGPDIESIKTLLQTISTPAIASGGISSLEDIKNLKELEKDGLAGVILGKALYENLIDLKEAINLYK